MVLDDDKYGHDFMGEARYPLDRLRPDIARQLNFFLEKHYPVIIFFKLQILYTLKCIDLL